MRKLEVGRLGLPFGKANFQGLLYVKLLGRYISLMDTSFGEQNAYSKVGPKPGK